MKRVRQNRRVWSAARWCAYFVRQRRTLLAVPWDRGPELTEQERCLVGPSLQEFQQGEGLEGRHFFHCVAAYGERTGERDYVEAHRLFMAEEKRHARDLARFLRMAGVPLLERQSWLNDAFCWLGSRGGLETTLAIILMVEVIAQTYYAALKGATGSAVLRRLCDQILRDEKSHVRFQAERLAILRRGRPGLLLRLTQAFDFFFFVGAGLACWWGHRRVLRAGGQEFVRFWRAAGERLRAAWGQKDPRRYDWDAPAPSIGIAFRSAPRLYSAVVRTRA